MIRLLTERAVAHNAGGAAGSRFRTWECTTLKLHDQPPWNPEARTFISFDSFGALKTATASLKWRSVRLTTFAVLQSTRLTTV